MTENQAEKFSKCSEIKLPNVVFDSAGNYAQVSIQATAELRAENERLDGQIEKLASFIMSNVPGEPSQSQGAIETAIRIISNLQTERDQAQAQVAALIKPLEAIKYHEERLVDAHIRDYNQDSGRREIMLKDRYYYQLAIEALKDTQATAEAHDAKVRQEAREAAIGECVSNVASYVPYYASSGSPGMIPQDGTIAALEALISDKPDDIKAVVKAAIELDEQMDNLESSSMSAKEIALSNAVFDLSPESLKMIKEA